MQRPFPLAAGYLNFSLLGLIQCRFRGQGDECIEGGIEFLNSCKARLRELDRRDLFLLYGLARFRELKFRQLLRGVTRRGRHDSFENTIALEQENT